MLSLQDSIAKELEDAVSAIQSKMNSIDFNASGKTRGSLISRTSKEVYGISGIIEGDKSLEWAETGRPPRTSSDSSGLSTKILEWMGHRGIGESLSEKNKENLANFITLKINRLGTKLWREKGSRGDIRDVYTATLSETKTKLENIISETFGEIIINQFRKDVNRNSTT